MKLTDAKVRALKATEKTQIKFDGGGLFIQVSTKGTKTWKYMYSFNGKSGLKITLGQYPELSLAEAREKHRHDQKVKNQGIDPKIAQKREKFEQENALEISCRNFKKVSEEWLKEYESKASQSTLTGKRRMLAILNNTIGEIPITEIERPRLLEIARIMERDGKSESANRLIMVANQVLTYAQDAGYIQWNVAQGLGAAINKTEVQHHAAIIEPEKFGEFLTKIDKYSGTPSVIYCLRISPYLALRSTEIRNAYWKEIDLENALWTIPAYRGERPQDGKGMKMRKTHTVPLPAQVIKLFKELYQYTGDTPLCFPGVTDKTCCITDASLTRAISRMGYKRDTTFHGLRTTFKTLATEHKGEWNIDRDAIERQLSHTLGNQVERAYDQSTMLAERAILMQKWADYLDGLKSAYQETSAKK